MSLMVVVVGVVGIFFCVGFFAVGLFFGFFVGLFGFGFCFVFHRGVCRILTGPCKGEGHSRSILSCGLLLGLALIQKRLSVSHSGQNSLV